MRLKHIFLSTFLAFTGILSATAQSELPKQRISFFAFEIPDGRTSIHVMNGKNAFKEVELPGANSTAPMDIVNSGGFIQIQDQPVNSAEGTKVYPILGKIKCSPSWAEAMVILVAQKKDGKDQFSGFAFPSSKTDLPLGGIKFANLSPFPVRCVLGDSKLMFKPGSIETIKLKEKAGTMVNVIFQYEEEGKWKRMMATQWAVTNDERVLLIAFRNPLTGNMASRSIPIQDQ